MFLEFFLLTTGKASVLLVFHLFLTSIWIERVQYSNSCSSTCSYHEGSGMFHLELFRSFLYHVILYVCRYNLGQREDSK